jgi:hypothetical protein
VSNNFPRVRLHALFHGACQGKLRLMIRHRLSLACGLIFLIAVRSRSLAQPAPAAVADFDAYVSAVEVRLSQQHASSNAFLARTSASRQIDLRLRRGELILEQLTPATGAEMPGALLHHWRGTAFAPGATAADFERLLRNFNAYPQRFAPQVLRARVLASQGNLLQASMRVRQKHVLTVVLDTTYDVSFGHLDPQDGYSSSRSTHIYEIDAAGTTHERTLSEGEEHGFLWRQNTYWTYQERDGGLYLQIESISLSRSIPTGLGWAIRPFVESVPRESLEFTLRSAINAVRK